MVVAGGLVLALAAACSSSGTSGGGDGAGSSGGSTATGSAWKLGNITTASGPASSTNGQAEGVLKAWQQWTNDHGGINGHKVEFTFKDDQQTPSTGLAAAQTLIHSNVLAIVGEASTTAKTWGSTVSKAGIPVIGGNPTSNPFGVDPDFYPQATTFSAGAYLLMKAAAATGVKKVAVLYCAENPQCAEFNPLLQAAAKQVGVEMSYTTAVSATSPSFTAPCLAAKSSGADGLIMTLANATLTSVATQCNQQGYHPEVVGAVGSIKLPTWTKDAAFDNASVQIDTFPWWDKSIPAVAEFQDAMQKYDPDGMNTPSIAASIWASAELFKAAAVKANLGNNPTPAQLKSGLDALSKETLGGLTPPLTFTGGNRTVKCGRFALIKNGAFQIVGNGEYYCSP